MPFPFEVGFDDVRSNLDSYVDAVFGCLESEFLIMPKGKGFVEFPAFEAGYESLKRATGNPNEFNPQVVIEAKLTEDDGTARDKMTRVQHLGSLSTAGQPMDDPKFEVIACIAGRGFGVRREDMRKLLLATKGRFSYSRIWTSLCCIHTPLSFFPMCDRRARGRI